MLVFTVYSLSEFTRSLSHKGTVLYMHELNLSLLNVSFAFSYSFCFYIHPILSFALGPENVDAVHIVEHFAFDAQYKPIRKSSACNKLPQA